MKDDQSGFERESNVTDTEDVSYVASAYVPQCLRHGGRPTLSNAHRAHECGISESNIRDELDEDNWSHACAARRSLDRGVGQIIQIGVRAWSREEATFSYC